MLKMLKFDFYKIFKSKMVLAFFIITLCLVFVEPIMYYVPYENSGSVYLNLYNSGTTLILISWIFIIPFVTKDFSSKFTKNLVPDYSLSDRIFYVLSKFVYIVAFCVLYMLLQFIVEIIFNYTLGEHCMHKYEYEYNYGFTVQDFYLRYFVYTLNAIAAGTVLMFLCLLLKREYIVLIIIVPYLFYFNAMFYGIIESLAVKYFNAEKLFSIDFYTVFGCEPGGDKGEPYGLKIVILLSYLALFIAGSILVFAKKGLKNGGCKGNGLINVNELKKTFGKKSILKDINLDIERGELYGLVGNNGAGKTTLLKIFCNMLKPTAGTISLNKEAFTSSVRIGALIEKPGLYFDMTAFQNIKAKALSLGVKYTDDQICNLLRLVGLGDTGKKDVRAFSMGMKQRLGIAMALVGEPDLLILDEPINGLDPQGILEIRNLLERIHREKDVTMVISSHILDELAKTATRFCVLNNGKIIKNCTKEEFLADCGDKDITEYYIQLIQSA